ncbi:MAG: type II secretion system F family protein [Armatimonadota bacterium]|nr:type II secretion system F family protein [Armatimonadota bacterium]MDR7402477.1 type II secretion system F family protein [Armatimonadota bacterium]MDR7437836.1 type II secretion system F family protein [Armatimonadota bacterium]MDR7472096.1 type II secretion system F family protein [Armatimonadota bacterium]MDR7507462.1 type II secretion system F family protein [Armatimonadota bacterium]
MATFRYSARDASGRVVAGAIEADTEVAVVGKLQEMGFYVTSLERAAPRADLRAGLRRLRRVGLRELTIFTRQFATMVNAGLSMVRTLTILEQQTESHKLRQIVSEVRKDVEEGMTLSDALAKHPDTFSTLTVNMVRAGEVGGVLDDVLNRLAIFFEKDLALRQKVRAAVTYPAAIFVFALGVIFFLVFFILPQFIGFFEGLELTLPLPTRVLIWFTKTLTGYWYVFLGFILLGLYGLRMYISTPIGRFRFDRFKLRVPVFGPLVRKVTISRFTRTLGTLITSGVPIMQALDVVAKAVENKVVAEAIENVRNSIREGESIALPLQASGLFPPMVVQMTSVGEETGTLDTMLQKVADFYDAEVETTLAQLTSILEPMLIVFLGFVVGFIVLSFYMPLYQLITGLR